MKLYILSLKESISFKPNENEKTVIIRINEPDYEVKDLKYKDLFTDILEVSFHDVVKGMKNLDDSIVLFNNEHSNKIIEFIKRHKDADTFVIHCIAGVSRSSAVGLSLSWILNNSRLEQAILKSKMYSPNSFILETMAKDLGIEKEKQSVIDSLQWDLNSPPEEFVW